METTPIKCEKCGGIMKKVDEHTMKCEGCGNTTHIDHEEEVKEETK